MPDLALQTLGWRAERMLTELGAISSESGRLVRGFLTPAHRKAADRVASWMRDAGMTVDEDALGTVRGHWGEGRRLLIGSHIDTVIDAGIYDGSLGVIAGILAVEHFAHGGKTLSYGIDVLAFGDEEGSRFPSTLGSSSACAGHFASGRLALTDAMGVRFADALRAYGKEPNEIPTAAYRPEDVAAYFEVHIEQGPVLEARNHAIGVVNSIYGQTHLCVDLMGEAGHAGTVPMPLRRDALAAAAEIVLAAEKAARESKGKVVATVGQLTIEPGARNVIPGHAVLTVDVRSGDDDTRIQFIDRFQDSCRVVAARRQLGLTITNVRDVPTTLCDRHLQGLLGAVTAEVGCDPRPLGSGAGHDGQAMAKLCPIGMLFVRCRGGVSHSPSEYTSADDIGVAIAALIRVLERFEPALK